MGYRDVSSLTVLGPSLCHQLHEWMFNFKFVVTAYIIIIYFTVQVLTPG